MPIHTVSERRKNKKAAQSQSFKRNVASKRKPKEKRSILGDIFAGFQAVLPGGSKKPLSAAAKKLKEAAEAAKRNRKGK